MSSPIVSTKKGFFKKRLVDIHQKVSHNHRLKFLEDRFYELIRETLIFSENDSIRCLDIGCGDMMLADKLSQKLPNSFWKCIDIHQLPDQLLKDKRWGKYTSFNGVDIPFDDKSFDLAIFCDVLHHAGPSKVLPLLKEAGRVAKYVIIKDHFEYGFYSRSILQLMDIVGNWAYGINIPNKYFTKNSWAKYIVDSNLRTEKMVTNLNFYGHLLFLNKLLNPKWQFLAVLSVQESQSINIAGRS